MSSIKANIFSINGVIDTSKNILDNLNDLCTASGCWLTYDIAQGKWAVVINRVGTSIASFNDSNIVGSINVSGTGLTELYNKVSIEFPHKDLKDATDFVELSIPSGDKYPNELENTLNMQVEIINDPIQAQIIAGRELKQSRVDKVIEFRSDYSFISLKGGDLIDVTSEMYGYTNKIFRVVSVEEDDSEAFTVSIRALEYDADVYDISDLSGGLVRTERSKQTDIVPKNINSATIAKDDISAGEQLSRLLIANGAASLLGSLFKRILGTNTFGPSEQGKTLDKLLRGMKKPDLGGISVPSSICAGDDISIIVTGACGDTCFLEIPDFDYTYEITGLLEEDIDGIEINGAAVDLALTGTITVSGGAASMLITTLDTAAGSTASITIGGINDSCEIFDNVSATYSTTSSVTSVQEGVGFQFIVNTTNVDDGTTIPYTLTETQSGLITSPSSKTGNLTINSNTASLSVQLANDSIYTGTRYVSITIAPDVDENTCHGTWDFTASVAVNDNELAPPTPPSDTTRQYTSVPVVWSGTYDGTSGQLKSISVLRSAYMPVPFAGESTVSVPTSLSVSQGNPSSITVTGSVSISTVSTLGGTLLQPITSFNTVAPSSAITGTRASIWGYY